MKKAGWIIIFLGMHICLFAQQPHENEEVVTKQCSVIRELVYSAVNSQFEPIRMEQVRGSSGHQTAGSWQFSTTRFNTNILWQGANISYLEHSEESTDSTKAETWQYIAEYSHVPDVLEAERLYRQLNSEIAGCIYPLNDSTDIAFNPLPPDQLPLERPASLEIASLYELPVSENSMDENPAIISVMVGMEKRTKDYRVSLIIENRLGRR